MIRDINDLRVAMVLNAYQVVLNAGSKDGVEAGASYVIFEDGPQIIDPITGNDLGNLEIVKGRVWIHHVNPAHSVAGSDRDPQKTIAAANNPLGSLRTFSGDASMLARVQVGDRAKRVS
ncbi:hypothetical protein D3C73_08510 [compost metagenome]